MWPQHVGLSVYIILTLFLGHFVKMTQSLCICLVENKLEKSFNYISISYLRTKTQFYTILATKICHNLKKYIEWRIKNKKKDETNFQRQ